MLGDTNEKKEEIIGQAEPCEEVMIHQISMLLSQYEEDIRTLLDEQRDVRQMKSLFKVFKQKEQQQVKVWESWLKNYSKHLDESQFFLESDKAAALKMYFSNTLLHIRLLAENAIELAQINCGLRKPDAPTSTNRKDWTQIFNVLRTPVPKKEISSFQLGEALREAITKTAEKIETLFQQTPTLVGNLFRLGSKLKTNLLWWLHAHRLAMVKEQFFSDKPSPDKREKAVPLVSQAETPSTSSGQKKNQSDEKERGNGYEQYLEEDEEEKLESMPSNPLDNQAPIPLSPPFSSSAYSSQALVPFFNSSEKVDTLIPWQVSEKMQPFAPGLQLMRQKLIGVYDHLDASEHQLQAFCEENKKKLAQMEEKSEQCVEKICKQQEEVRRLQEEARQLQEKDDQQLEAMRKQQEEARRRQEEKDRETAKQLEAMRQEQEEARRRQEERDRETAKQLAAMQAMLLKFMQEQAEKEASQKASPAAANRTPVAPQEAKDEVSDEKVPEKASMANSFARACEGLFALPEDKEKMKHKQINELVEQTTNEKFALAEKDQQEQTSITTLTS